MDKLRAEKLNGLAAFVCACFCGAAVFMAVLSGMTLANETRWAAPVCIVALALFLTTVVVVRGRDSNRRFALLLFALAFLLKGVFALAVNTQPDSDFYLMYSAARDLAQGINSMAGDGYFQTWSYQSAFVVWMALFIRLFNASLVFFKLMNCLFSALSTVLIYLLARRFASERGARVSGLLFMCYPGTFILVSVLTPQHLSEFLLLAAVYAFSSPGTDIKRRLLLSAAAGVLLALSNAARPLGTLVLLAVAASVIGAMTWLKNRGYKITTLLSRAAVFLAVYFVFTAGLSGLVKITGLNEHGLANNLPEWKIIVGLNQ